MPKQIITLAEFQAFVKQHMDKPHRMALMRDAEGKTKEVNLDKCFPITPERYAAEETGPLRKYLAQPL